MARVACLGMAVWDRIFSVPQLPHGSMKLYARDLTEIGGGPAATASVAIVKLGGQARLLGRVGRDDVGQRIADELAAYGVDTTGLRQLEGARSAWSSVLIDPAGERLIVNFPGAGLDVAPSWIDETLLADCGALLVDMGWRKGAVPSMRMARSLGIPVVLDADLSPDPETVELIAAADHVLFSEPALYRLTSAGEPAGALKEVLALAPQARVIGVTLGERGCLFMENGVPITLPAFKVDVVDTLGAGDVFHGAYALAIAEGSSAAEAVCFSNAAGAIKCTRPGGRAGAPTRSEVDALLATSSVGRAS